MVAVIVSYRTLPGLEDAVAALLGPYVGTVRQEPGCLAFEASQNEMDRSLFHLYEVYSDREALEAHKGSTHYRAFVEEVIPLLADRTVDVGEPLGVL